MKIVNLTPHAINLVTREGDVLVIAPSGAIARVSSSKEESTIVLDGKEVTLARVTFGEVVGLPPPEEGVLFLVSALVRTAYPSRGDLVSPGEALRDAGGNVTGCRGLAH